MRPAVLLLPLALAACAPDPRAPPLAPLGPLLAAADALPPEPAFAPALRAEAGALAGRAAGLPAPGDPGLSARADDLGTRAAAIPAPGASGADRLAALRARAEALRDGVLSEEERQRLEAGPSLPAAPGPANSAPDP